MYLETILMLKNRNGEVRSIDIAREMGYSKPTISIKMKQCREEGYISVDENDEVGQAMASNPRTAIGIVDTLHYLFVVSDGRTSVSEGLSLQDLAQVLLDLGAKTAYNLDGGGSSPMVFQGDVVNRPTTNGKKISERSVSDIVCITL